jgi:hypothetical protein
VCTVNFSIDNNIGYNWSVDKEKYFKVTRICNNPEGRKSDCPVAGNMVKIGPPFTSKNQVREFLETTPELICPNPCSDCGQYLTGASLRVENIKR